jgi:hypothetical protein
MWSSEVEPEWHRLTAQVLAEMQTWRDAHPAATLSEIEQELDARLAAARACLLEATILATSPTDPPPEARPRCPDCGAAMRWEGTRPRRLTTTHNRDVILRRSYARCPQCGTGVFPPR